MFPPAVGLRKLRGAKRLLAVALTYSPIEGRSRMQTKEISLYFFVIEFHLTQLGASALPPPPLSLFLLSRCDSDKSSSSHDEYIIVAI
jgi:hypothetical protein